MTEMTFSSAEEALPLWASIYKYTNPLSIRQGAHRRATAGQPISNLEGKTSPGEQRAAEWRPLARRIDDQLDRTNKGRLDFLLLPISSRLFMIYSSLG